MVETRQAADVVNQALVVSAWTVLGAAAGTGLALVTCGLMSTPGNRRTHVLMIAVGTAVLFGLLALRVSMGPELLGYSTFAALGVSVSAIDVAEHRLPSALVLPAYPAIVVMFAWAALVHHDTTRLALAAAGMLVLPAFYLTLALVSRGGVGAGDVRLAGPAGWVLGWHGWTALAAGTLLALLYAAAAGLALIIIGRATRRTPIPFGPAMVAGALTMIFVSG